MLDPDILLPAVLAAIQSIPEVLAEVGGSLTNSNGNPTIYAHQYLYGVENSITRAIEQQEAGTLMLAYLDLLEGNFSGYGRWKHRLELYIRPNNAADGGAPAQPHSSPLHLAWLVLNRPLGLPAASGQNLRTYSILPQLLCMDTPTILSQTDSQDQDYFKVLMSIPEQGDS